MTTAAAAAPRPFKPLMGCIVPLLLAALFAYAVYYLFQIDSFVLVPFLLGSVGLFAIDKLVPRRALLVQVAALIAAAAYGTPSFNESFAGGIAALFICAFLSGFIPSLVRGFTRGLLSKLPDTADLGDNEFGRVLLGLSGYAQSGKDTAAKHLVGSGWTRVSFADKLRAFTYAVNPLVPKVIDGIPAAVVSDGQTYIMVERLSELVDRVGWEAAKNDNTEVRSLLQKVGTDAGRKVIGENVWVDAVMADLPEGDLVFTDCRFENEADAIRNAGGLVFRVNRPGKTRINRHVSETALDDYGFDAIIENDGTPDDLGLQLSWAVAAHTGELVAPA